MPRWMLRMRLHVAVKATLCLIIVIYVFAAVVTIYRRRNNMLGENHNDTTAPEEHRSKTSPVLIVASENPTRDLAQIVMDKDRSPTGRGVLLPDCRQKMEIFMVQVTGVADARGVGLIDIPAKEGAGESAAITVQINVKELIDKAWSWPLKSKNQLHCDEVCLDMSRTEAIVDYETGERYWAKEAQETLQTLSQSLIDSGLKAGQWHAFSTLAKAGQYRKAVLQASTFYTGQDEPTGGFKEPENAVRVMYNARFWFFGAAHDCRTLVSSGCWGKIRKYHLEADSQECISPQSKQPRYGKVAMVSSKKSLPYYHFFMEVLPRIALILPLLHEDPSILIALDTSITKGSLPRYVSSFLAVMGISTNRLIPYSKHDGGCADLLIYPEATSCLGPTFAQLHVLRSTLLACMVGSGASILTSSAHAPAQNGAAAEPYIMLVNRDPIYKRHVANFDELKAELVRELGSHVRIVVHTGREKMLEQLQNFAGAKGVVAPHGAALSNLIVMKKHSAVVEYLSEGKDIVLVYMMIAFKLELKYQGIVTPGNTHTGVWHVNAHEGAAMMKYMLGH